MELAGSAAAALAAEAVLEVAARLTIRSAVYAAIMMIFLRDFGVNRHGNIQASGPLSSTLSSGRRRAGVVSSGLMHSIVEMKVALTQK